MLFLAVMLPVICLTAAPAAKPVTPAEKKLRARVDAFYKLAVAHKFREMEALVAPESRDDYYAGDKPDILDYRVEGVQWLEGGRKANVTMVSKVYTRHIKTGDEINEVPYASHWEMVNGLWYWYLPHVNRRVTSFGPMKVDPEKAAASHLNLKEMIRKGPDMAELMNGVHAESTRMELGQEPGATASMELTNKLPGTVELAMTAPVGAGFTCTLAPEMLKSGEKAILTLHSIPGIKQDASIGIQVRPTGQNLVIQVNYIKPKP